MIRTLCASALSAVLLSGCFFVEAEEPSICKTVTDQAIGPLAPGTTQFSAAYDYDFGDSLLNFGDKQVTTDLRVLNVTFTLKSGAPNLDFIDHGKVSLVDPDGVKPELKILSYQRTAPVTDTLTLSGGDDIDVTQFLNGGNTRAHVELSGAFPGDTTVTVDVKACLYAKVHYDYL